MATQFSGGTYANTTFTGAVRSDIQSNLLAQLVIAGWTNVAQAVSQGLGGVHTITLTIASPCVVTDTGHGFSGGERVILQVSAGGALPTGLSVNTVYFIKYVGVNSYNFSTTSGGTNINTSGSQSGTIVLNTESILLQSATQTNVTNPIRVRLKDLLGSCISVFIENSAGTITPATSVTYSAGFIFPGAGKTFRIIATCYHFICLVPGSTAGRDFVMAGMPYVPSFLASVTDIGYVLSSSQGDTSSNICNSPRLSGTLNSNPTPNIQCIYNTSLLALGATANTAGVGFPDWVLSTSITGGQKAYRWANDDLNSCDILMQWGLTAITDEGKLKGQLFDILWIGDAFVADATDTFNGHDWYNLTSNNTGSPRGGFWVAIS